MLRSRFGGAGLHEGLPLLRLENLPWLLHLAFRHLARYHLLLRARLEGDSRPPRDQARQGPRPPIWCCGVTHQETIVKVHRRPVVVPSSARSLPVSVAPSELRSVTDGISTRLTGFGQFTITSAPEDPFVSVHIRQFGDWTQALGERVGATPTVIHTIKHATGVVKNGESSTMQDGPDEYVELGRNASSPPLPVVRIDGPYGGPYVDAFRSEVAILIGAGIGVTPFASVLKHIWYRQKRGTLGALQRVEFFWIFREADSFRWFENLLQEVESAQTDCMSRLDALISPTKNRY